MTKTQLERNNANQEIDNYDMAKCESCGGEIKRYITEQAYQHFIDNGNICSECVDNIY